MSEREITQPKGWTVWVEDLLNLAALIPIWVIMMGYRGPWLRPLLYGTPLLLLVLFVRRKRRVDQMFRELREREEESRAGFPFVPGAVPPTRLTERPGADRQDVKRS